MKTEKVSVNLSPTELGQIDLLVERGLYDNRSDFMRAAARKALETHAADFQQFLEPRHLKDEAETELMWALGIARLTKSEVAHFISKGKKLNIRVIGIFNVEGSITPEEIKQVVLSCKVSGKLIADDSVKDALGYLRESGN